MSEKRFVLCKKGDVEYIEDNCCVQLYGFDVLCDLLNGQDNELHKYRTENAKLHIDILEIEKEVDDLKEEKEQLRQSIDSMIETSAEISNRNVQLHEQLGETQFNHKQCEKKVKELEQKLDWICEQTGFDGVKFHYINKEVVQ